MRSGMRSGGAAAGRHVRGGWDSPRWVGDMPTGDAGNSESAQEGWGVRRRAAHWGDGKVKRLVRKWRKIK